MARTTTPRTPRTKPAGAPVAAAAAPVAAAAAPNAPLPKGVAGNATVTFVGAKPYAPRANTNNSTRTQWAALQAAVAAGHTAQQVVNAAAVAGAPLTNAAYLSYVLRRGWAKLAS